MPFTEYPAVIPGPRSGARNPVRVTTLGPRIRPPFQVLETVFGAAGPVFTEVTTSEP